MRQVATIHIYDVMSDVQISVQHRTYPDYAEGPQESAFTHTALIPGAGEADPRVWLEDALIGLLETL